MQIRFWLVVALMMFSRLHGNAQSIQPFYTLEDVIFKPELLGRWNLDGVSLEFRDSGQNTYGITMLGEDGFALHFRAHLIRIRHNYFLDGQISGVDIPEKDSGDGKGKVQSEKSGASVSFDLDEHDIFLNRHHGLLLVDFSDDPDEFTLHAWQDEFLPTLAAKKKLSCPFVKDEMGRILLTGSTTQLRAFVTRLPRDAFDGGETLTRNKANQH